MENDFGVLSVADVHLKCVLHPQFTINLHKTHYSSHMHTHTATHNPHTTQQTHTLTLVPIDISSSKHTCVCMLEGIVVYGRRE